MNVLTDTSLSDRIGELVARIAQEAPPEISATIVTELRKLSEAGIAARAPSIGARAPGFTLPDARGGQISLASLLARGPVVVTFYRGAWCPFCDLQLRSYQGVLTEIRRLGAELVAISPQIPDFARADIEKKQLTFPVLTDAGNRVARQYGLVFSLSQPLRELQERFGNPLPRFNGDESWELPMPGTFVLDPKGIVRLVHVDPNYMKRLEPKAILDALREMQMNPVTVTSATPKQQVRDLLKAIETGESAPVAVINPSKLIQHNLAVGDGLAGFGAVLQQLPRGSARVSPARVFQDGDFVFAHSDLNFFGPKIGFDVYRFENGKIVEHWDNLQEKPAEPNPSGHSMIDGPTEATDLPKTEANKALVRTFIDDVLVNGRMGRLAGFFDGDRFIQHNPQVGDGLSGLGGALEALAKQGFAIRYDRIHRVLGEGNFVLVLSEGSFGDRPTSFFDLFRIENGKIAEHWDTIEAIPPQSEWKNNNGKF